MNTRENKAFTLVETMMGLLLFAVLVSAMIPAVDSLGRLIQTGRENGRRAAAVPLQEMMIAQGINPASSQMTNNSELAYVRETAPTLTRTTWSDRPGSMKVYLISGETGHGTNHKVMSFGFQLGRGSDATPRGPLVPATPPIVIGSPSVSPGGPSLALSSFVIPPTNPGDAWSIQITVTGADAGNLVKIRFQGAIARASSGVGSATLNLSASEIVSGGTLQAWGEYAGGPSDSAESLGDGRTRWWTGTNVYEPSAMVTKNYRVSIGAPTLFLDGTPYANGASISISKDQSRSITSALVGYDASVLSRLGSGPVVTAYSAQFNLVAIVGAPNVGAIFSDTMLPTWSASNSLQAQPLGLPSGLEASSGDWAFSPSSIRLGTPELLSTPYDADHVEGGLETIGAPFRGASRVGRVEAGEHVSLGPVLDVPVGP